jgi:hypothetical protein
MFSGAHDVQIVNSNLTVVCESSNHIHHHYGGERDIWAILRLVPNFRDIYHDMLEKITQGTGMWLVKGDKFRVWLEPNGDIKIFWGSGIRKSWRCFEGGPSSKTSTQPALARASLRKSILSSRSRLLKSASGQLSSSTLKPCAKRRTGPFVSATSTSGTATARR